MAHPKVAIYTLTFNRLNYTKSMIEQLRKHTKIPYDHFIIDNGSTDGTVEFLRKKPYRVKKVVYNKDNKGICIGQNQALKSIGNKYDYIIKIDNDIEIISDNWLEMLIDISKRFKDAIILSPKIDYGEKINEDSSVKVYKSKEIAGHKIMLTHHIGGMFRFAHKKIYEKYIFDEKRPLYYGRIDKDFSDFFDKEGFLLGFVDDIIAKDDWEQHRKDYPSYYKKQCLRRYSHYNEKISNIKKIINSLKAINYYYSERGAGRDTLLGKIILPTKDLIKSYKKLEKNK